VIPGTLELILTSSSALKEEIESAQDSVPPISAEEKQHIFRLLWLPNWLCPHQLR
jgi:hypothetical protein